MKRITIALSLIATLAAHPLPAQAPAPAGCAADSTYALLDFWVGRWDVVVNDKVVGSNHIEKVLGGCAVLEHWRDASGSEGKSLFYYSSNSRRWEQVWVTDAAGRMKEKHFVARYPDGGIRFQGEGRTRAGSPFFDRTTLTPLAGGRVRQRIEISTDGGETWDTGFDAVYVPAGTRR